MVVLDTLATVGQGRIARLRLGFDRFTLTGTIALAAALLVLGTIVFNGLTDNAFRLGSQVGWRFTTIVFFTVLAACPVGRLAGRILPAARVLEDRTPDLIWGFCASYGIYLLAVLLPNAIRLSGGALLFVLFGAMVTAVMALTAAPLRLSHGGTELIAAKIRRTLLGTAMIYFWMCYALMALERISGPHRADTFYGISLLLMILGLLLRFADRWVGPAQECCLPRDA
jgi:hypothetical protein